LVVIFHLSQEGMINQGLHLERSKPGHRLRCPGC
jgi:hypothetical protein